jgi:pyruvate,water dikinase
MAVEDRFASPFEVETPEGAEGWERMYPYFLLFSKDNAEYDDGNMWFRDALHHMEALQPFDTITFEAWGQSLSAYNGRVFAVPPAHGIDQRVINGYLYVRPVPIEDEAWVAERVDHFMERAGYYFQNWDELFGRWRDKMEGVIADLRAVQVPVLPKLEDKSVVMEAKGITTGYELMRAYNETIDSLFLAYQHHFEMLNLGYGAYLNLFEFARAAFPGIKDETIVQLVAGTDILMFGPDDRLRELAKLAVESGIDQKLLDGVAEPGATVEALRGDSAAAKWIQAFDEAQDPWFQFSSGTGLYHHERAWIDDLTVPWSALTNYIEKLRKGEDIERHQRDVIARRDRLTAEYRDLLTEDSDREAFDQNVGLARTVAAYIEDHNFFVEHRHHTVFWNKMREFGDRLVEGGFLDDREDVFWLNRFEIPQALYDLVMGWSVGAPRPGTTHWRREIDERRKIHAALAAWSPPPALGPVPDEISEAFTVMLWGITTDRVKMWLGADEAADGTLNGVPASPGVREGLARVIRTAAELPSVQPGEILVCPITAPAWGPVFGTIQAAVSDIGGVMSHAAIVSREYGMPAVVGTGNGTSVIKTGDRIRVDGDTGLVQILERAESA